MIVAFLWSALAEEPSSAVDVRFGTGIAQFPTHMYLQHRARARVGLHAEAVWALPFGRIQPVVGVHLGVQQTRWLGSTGTFDRATRRLEPRGGARLALADRVTLDLTFGWSFDVTESVRSAPVVSGTTAWLGPKGRWLGYVEGRAAPVFFRVEEDGGEHLFNIGGAGLLVGVGVRY